MSYPYAELLEPVEPYEGVARRLQEELGFAYPWVAGKPGVYHAPLVLRRGFAASLFAAAEAVGRLYERLNRLVWEEPALLDFFSMTPLQRLMWESSGGLWHGFARLDVFVDRSGRLRVAEINADTPTGQVEATGLGPLFMPSFPGYLDPAARYEARLIALLERMHAAQRGPGAPLRRVGILYPTDIPEDLSLIRRYTGWLEARGLEVVLGSPYNLQPTPSGGVALFNKPLDLVLRHYKTDWWGEREPLFFDEAPLPDTAPLERPLGLLLAAEAAREVTVVNPFGSVLAQNKLALAFFWEERHRFSPEEQAIIDAYLPETRRVITLSPERLIAERADWVLKSDFGCEGEEVFVGAYTPPEVWAEVVGSIVPEVWAAQRFFDILPLNAEAVPNYGVYLIAGVGSGLYVRLDPIGVVTDERTRAVPALIEP